MLIKDDKCKDIVNFWVSEACENASDFSADEVVVLLSRTERVTVRINYKPTHSNCKPYFPPDMQEEFLQLAKDSISKNDFKTLSQIKFWSELNEDYHFVTNFVLSELFTDVL